MHLRCALGRVLFVLFCAGDNYFAWLVAMYLCVHGTTNRTFFVSSSLCIIFIFDICYFAGVVHRRNWTDWNRNWLQMQCRCRRFFFSTVFPIARMKLHTLCNLSWCFEHSQIWNIFISVFLLCVCVFYTAGSVHPLF